MSPYAEQRATAYFRRESAMASTNTAASLGQLSRQLEELGSTRSVVRK
jgi:hypothetical protein